MVGMPLLNLGYALGGLTGGYNQAQSQAMQRAAQQLALQQAQAQIAGRQALSRYLQSPDFKGFGGGLGGAFSPGNIQPVSQPAPAPIPGVTTPSPAPPPPVAQQPPSADPAADYRPMTPRQWTEADPDTQVRDAVLTEEGVTATSEDKPPGQSSTSASPVTTTADTKPAPGPASDAKPSTAPASTTSDASGGTGGGGQMGIQIGNQTIPLSDFFNTLDYGAIAKGIAKYVPPGTDQSAIYEAVLDLSKLAEGNRTQQQQAGLILRQLLGQDFKLVQQSRAIEARHEDVGTQQSGAMARTQAGIAGRAAQGQLNRESRAAIAAASRAIRQQNANISSDREQRLQNEYISRLEKQAADAGRNAEKDQLSVIRARISTIKPGPNGAFDANQQKQLAALNAQAAAIGEQIAAQAATAAPAQQ